MAHFQAGLSGLGAFGFCKVGVKFFNPRIPRLFSFTSFSNFSQGLLWGRGVMYLLLVLPCFFGV